MQRIHLITSAAALLACVAPTGAQSWSLVTTNTSPAAQGYQQSLAYHVGSQRVVMYGGRTTSVLSETWAYDGTDWALQMPANDPGPKWGHRLVYDWARNRVILFGGRDAGTTAQNETWAWDGVNWTQLTTLNAPSPRAWHQMAYDARRDVVVVFGGFSVRDAQTWEFDGNDWLAVQTASVPPIVGDGEMVYDRSRGVCVLFGGWDGAAAVYAGTWEYDGFDWRPVTTANAPSGRTWHQMSYDENRDHVVLHGGYAGAVQSDTWTYDGTDWTLQLPTGQAPSVPVQGGMCYDFVRDVHVFFGGSGPTGRSADTNEFSSLAYASYAPSGSGCAGSAGTPLLEATGGSVPQAGTTLTAQVTGVPASTPFVVAIFGLSNTAFGPSRLPFELSLIGLGGCYLHCSTDVAFGVPVAAGVAQFSLAIPSGLTGGTFWNQVFVPDAGAGNPGAAVVSNACRGFIAR